MPSSFQRYVAKIQRPAEARHNIRVSTLRPLKVNSFQNFVPTGIFHSSGSEVSIADPAGRNTQRALTAPSDHNGYCGENGRLRGSIVPTRPSA